MDPIAVSPRIIGWLPTIAIVLAVGATVLGAIGRNHDDEPSPGRRALPFALLFAAAFLAIASTAAEAIVDSRIGIREVSMAALGLVCGTPTAAWLLARLRWGAPGRRTFHQQIASNRAGSVVLLVVLVEVLALTGFVIGATVGAVFGGALGGGLIVAAVAVVLAFGAAIVAARRGPAMVLDAVGARPIDDRHDILRNVVEELSLAAGIVPPSIHIVIDPAPNAFAVGVDPHRAAIAVTTGLLDQLDREELQGVIAHEIGHIRNLDSRYGLFVAVIVGAVVLLAGAFAAMLTGWSVEGNGLGGLIAGICISLLAAGFGWLVRSCATVAARAVQASVSREREFLADATSVELTRNPSGLIRALATISAYPAGSRGNAAMQHLWFASLDGDEASTDGWFATHPAPFERIARLRALAGQLERTPTGTDDPAIA